MGLIVNRKPPKTPSLLCRAYMWTRALLAGKVAHPWRQAESPGQFYCRFDLRGDAVGWVYPNMERTKWGWSSLLPNDEDQHGQAKTFEEAKAAADRALESRGWKLLHKECEHPNRRMVSQPPGFDAEYHCPDCDKYFLVEKA